VAISGHEMILILRARDEASRVLRNIEGNIGNLSRAQQAAARRTISQGAALATVGIGIAAVGAAGMAAFSKAIDTAAEYNRTVALTSTQTDKVSVSMKQLSDIGLMVARTIPVPFEEIQPMLYDIFSSMDVNTAQATKLLQSFSRAAVGGQVPLQEAGRATIAILNAYRMPAEKVNQVNDFMFQLVRKGVGTYHEFSTTIGRSIPSAVRAGQTYQALGGMLAFLTRNGLSTAMATASAGRALDAISNPNTVDKLKNFGDTVKDAVGQKEAIRIFGQNWKSAGINVLDANGNFLPMTTIMKKLSDVLGNLPRPERAAILQQLFKGSGGTIQARRFFDTAIPGIKEFTKLTNDMYANRGAAADAYQKMLATPAMQAQLFQNKVHALVVEIGTYLLPMKMKLLAIGNRLIDMWNNLSPSVRKTIVQVAAAATVFVTVLGVVVAMAGGILMLRGAFMLMGTSMGAVLGPAALIIAAVIAIGAALIYAYNHSTTFRNFVNNLGSAMVTAAKAIVTAIQASFTWVVNTAIPWLRNAWANVSTFLRNTWNNMVGWWNTATTAISNVAHKLIDPLIAWMKGIWGNFQAWYALHAEQLKRLWEYVTNSWKFLTTQFGNWVLPFLRTVWTFLSNSAKAAWTLMVGIVKAAWALIHGNLSVGFIVLKAAWNILWQVFESTVKVAWSTIYNIVAAAWHIISGAFSIFLDLITGHWKTAWEDAKRLVNSVWGNIKAIFNTWAHESLTLLKTVGINLWNGLVNGISSGVHAVVDAAKNLAKSIYDSVRSFFGISSPSTVMAEIGGHIMQGLWNGMMNVNPVKVVGKIFGGMPDALASLVNKGMVSISQLPGKALTALQGAGGWAVNHLKSVGGWLGDLLGGNQSGGSVKYGRGVSQWSTLVLQALTMLGQPASWLGTVLSRMQRESGGNPRAINLWDSNAKAGDPSKGLMQTISGTFNAYAGPLRGRGIWDPLANIYAGLNYALHRYGSLSALNRPGGYALGTLMASPGWRVVGERGPELVRFNGGEQVRNRGQLSGIDSGTHWNVTQNIYTNEINPIAHANQLAWELEARVA
jgi:TP901 family phage tail tape measure protein